MVPHPHPTATSPLRGQVSVSFPHRGGRRPLPFPPRRGKDGRACVREDASATWMGVRGARTGNVSVVCPSKGGPQMGCADLQGFGDGSNTGVGSLNVNTLSSNAQVSSNTLFAQLRTTETEFAMAKSSQNTTL